MRMHSLFLSLLWQKGLEIRFCISYSCRRSEGLSQYPYGCTQSSVTPVPEDLVSSSGHCSHTHGAYIRSGKTFICIKKKTDESNLGIERLVLACCLRVQLIVRGSPDSGRVRQLITSQPRSGSREERCCSVHSLPCIQSRTPAIHGCYPLVGWTFPTSVNLV